MKKTRVTIYSLLTILGLFCSSSVFAKENSSFELRESPGPLQAIPPALDMNLGPDDPDLDNPVLGQSAFLINQLFVDLFRLDTETGEPIPELVESWTMSPGATQFTFTLRDDIQWSDGSTVTASDVRFGIIHSLENSDMAYLLDMVTNAYDYRTGGITNPNLVGVTVIDPTHIQFSLDYSAAYFPSVLAVPMFKPLPSAVITAHPGDWSEPGNILTSGAYIITQWNHGVSMTLQRNPNYYDTAQVSIDQVNFVMVDENTAWTMYLGDQLDTVMVPESEWATATATPVIKDQLQAVSRICTYYYGFNTTKAPFDNPLARKAFIAAVDRQGLIDNFLPGYFSPAQTFTPPTVYGHVDGVTAGVGIPNNPAQAQQWLSDAGYPGGAGLPPITLMYNESTGHADIAGYIKQNWSDNLGVTVLLDDLPWNEYLDLLITDPPQIWRLGWCGDYYEAYNFVGDGIDPVRFGNWTNAAYDTLLGDVEVTGDLNLRKAKYEAIEEILVETDAIMMPIYYYGDGWATNPDLIRSYGASGWGGYIADWYFKGTFSDVTFDHWAYLYVEAIADAGLTGGYPDGTYRPENRVTRAEMAVFLLNALGISPGPLPGEPSFSDIDGHWAEIYIEELYDQKITGGYPDGTYRPENRVTRAEMAVFLLKGIGVNPPPIDGSHPFSDIEGHWAEIFIEELEDQGITGGYPDGTYRPENRVTRAEMAVFLVNTFGIPLP